jgi:hypothetical protein
MIALVAGVSRYGLAIALHYDLTILAFYITLLNKMPAFWPAVKEFSSEINIGCFKLYFA